MARQHAARNSPSRNCLRTVVRRLGRYGRIAGQDIVISTRLLQTSEILERAKVDDLTKLDAVLPEGSMHVIEDGLRLKVIKGKKIFEARYRKNGLYRSRRVGSHPETPIDEVRKNMRLFFDEIESEATQWTEHRSPPADKPDGKNRRKANHKNGEIERFFLQTEAHCWRFIRDLIHFQNGIALEYRLAIFLLLALPAHPKDLLTAQWSDIQSNKLFHSQMRHSPRSPDERWFECVPHQRFSWISPTCEKIFNDLRCYTGKQKFIFPTLAEIGTQERTIKLNSILEDLFVFYPLKISGLHYTFVHFANKYSEFKPEFINSLLTKKYKLAPPHERFYEFQIRSLLTWWGSNLERLLHMDPYVSKHDFNHMDFEFIPPKFTYPRM